MNDLLQWLRSDPNAANALGALASALVALLALVVSAVSVVVALWSLRAQRHHNKLSVRPLPEVTVADYEDSIRVKIRNNGSGPLIIRSLTVLDGAVSRPSVIEWMPPLPDSRTWTHFSHALSNRSLLPGHEIVLLELTALPEESGFDLCRDIVRSSLAPLRVTVDYSDVYDSALPSYEKRLDWFGRHAVGA